MDYLILMEMRLALRKIFSIFLLLVFFIETTPDGLLHLLANHEDTHDVHLNENVVGEKHIHCKALQNFFPAFSLNELVSLPAILFIVVPQKFYFTSVHSSSVVIIKQGRGPPSVV